MVLQILNPPQFGVYLQGPIIWVHSLSRLCECEDILEFITRHRPVPWTCEVVQPILLDCPRPDTGGQPLSQSASRSLSPPAVGRQLWPRLHFAGTGGDRRRRWWGLIVRAAARAKQLIIRSARQ